MGEHVTEFAIGVGEQHRLINRLGVFETDELHGLLVFGLRHFAGDEPADHTHFFPTWSGMSFAKMYDTFFRRSL